MKMADAESHRRNTNCHGITPFGGHKSIQQPAENELFQRCIADAEAHASQDDTSEHGHWQASAKAETSGCNRD
jgi:hypothetical protein